ncbi:RNA 2',3'-cyclic phosphodiesterase [Ornithinibacillus bavariensis]|uniref:RNA 2',3'-cyclic phosphodiesterase n=1 Tax=Ornithinibacillus bavariensis TaxID=545502 RepID=A0A919XBX4_9BACI|nr:RNA 2',3'-cyclic phosphodiesterase [Ornithinibacillus bavariensis]GIO28814.1 RNA 2',3'-cyclic phosphodiesterase [Ornithinibacillus bavariensis]
MNTPHYFIAIPVAANVKEEFAKWQEELKKSVSYKQWPWKEDLHITLKFLGAVEEERIIQLQELLRTIAKQNHFSISVGGIGTFGRHNSPRVLWAGVEKTEPLEILFKQIENAVTSIGFPKETRPYTPHITLAKKWNGNDVSPEKLQEIKEHYQELTFPMNVDSFVLYQIFPSKRPKYEVVELYKL